VASSLLALGIALLLAACSASRPVNPPIAAAGAEKGYRFETALGPTGPTDDLIILAFSGGGTRAAAFSYGVLEALRDVEIDRPKHGKRRLLDSVSVIAGVSGGSFTALAYGLYGDELFGQYETRFLKRDVEGTLFSRLLDPINWGPLSSSGWGRSELAADYYDEILFNGATYADLLRRPGPLVIANATDLSTGARFYFSQSMFDIICSDLGAVRLSRAAAASSAVPVIFSPVTFNNYGGSCGARPPEWFVTTGELKGSPALPLLRATAELDDLRAFADGEKRPYIHLVDGGVADNLALRGVLGALTEFEALRLVGRKAPLDTVRRIVVFVVNSESAPANNWDRSEDGPGPIEVLLQAVGVPIDRYSYDAVLQLWELAARWELLNRLREVAAPADRDKPVFELAMRVPRAQISIVEVSFARVESPEERAYLNQLPTSFVLPGEAVDRLRRAAKSAVLDSPSFKQYLQALREDRNEVRVTQGDRRLERPD
jgi:NTE family protein